jgi:hypothetical protein
LAEVADRAGNVVSGAGMISFPAEVMPRAHHAALWFVDICIGRNLLLAETKTPASLPGFCIHG